MTVKDACEKFAGYNQICLAVEDKTYELAIKDCERVDPNMMLLFGNCIVDYILACGDGHFLITLKMEPCRVN